MKRIAHNKSNTETFVAQAREKFGNAYDYTNVEYIGNKSHVTIICQVHGEFMVSPYRHLRSKGCPKCSRIRAAVAKAKEAAIKFIEKVTEVHNDRYNYSNVYYITSTHNVEIICPDHGSFYQTPNNHLSGRGCYECGRIAISEKGGANRVVKAASTFVKRANKVHNNKYDYSKTEYTGNRNTITVTCPVHGDFTQRAVDHLSGSGCTGCADYGFNKDIPAILYYFEIKGLYKIGITNRTVQERYCATDNKAMRVIAVIPFDKGADARIAEQKILSKYSNYRYSGKPVMKDGNTELFTKDVLKMD